MREKIASGSSLFAHIFILLVLSVVTHIRMAEKSMAKLLTAWQSGRMEKGERERDREERGLEEIGKG